MLKEISFTEVEKSVVEEHNNLRRDPKSYVSLLNRAMTYFRRNNVLHYIGETPFKTKEGKPGVQDAIRFIEKCSPVPELKASHELSLAAKDYLADIQKDESAELETRCYERIEKFCEWDISCSQNLSFGLVKGENILTNLIINDGDGMKYSRQNLFDPELRYIGVAAGPSRLYEVCVVIYYASRVRKLNTIVDEKDYYSDYINVCDKVKARKIDITKARNTIEKEFETKVNNKTKKILKSIYEFEDGSTYIVENEK